jgi:hypothetical protein
MMKKVFILCFLGFIPLTGLLRAQEAAPPGSRVVNRPDLRIGDSWVFHYPYNQRKATSAIQNIKNALIYVTAPKNNCGMTTLAYTQEWAQVEVCGFTSLRPPRPGPITYDPPLQFMPFPVWPGKQWSLKYTIWGGAGSVTYYAEGKAIGWETITVPAGTFEALKIEVTITAQGQPLPRSMWYAPEANNFIKAVVVDPQRDFEL